MRPVAVSGNLIIIVLLHRGRVNRYGWGRSEPFAMFKGKNVRTS